MSNERDNADSEEQKPDQFVPMDAIARVQPENGRWVVYLNVQSWEPSDQEHPVANNWKRINDFATEQEARVAASWYEKSANRTIRPPSGF